MDRNAEDLRVHVFGGLELWFRGRRWRGFETRKAAALFGFLVVNGTKQIARSRLAGLLWPDKDDARARQNLRQAVYSVAATLPRHRARHLWLLVDSDRIGLDPASGIRSDLATLVALLAEGQGAAERSGTHLLGRAVNLYQGDLLAGLDVADCPEFELWLVGEQERFRSLVIDALRRLASAYLARGEHRLGVHYARRLIEMDPFNEEGHRLLMALLALAGNRAAAATHFRVLVEAFDRELGVAPSHRTSELNQLIASADVSASEPDNEVGLRPFVPLVGRKKQMERLLACWQPVASGRGGVTVVEGEQGIGKTRFVRSFLDGLAAREPVRILDAAESPHRFRSPFSPLDRVISRLFEEETAVGAVPLSDLTPLERRVLAAIAPQFVAVDAAVSIARGTLSLDVLARGCASLLQSVARSARGEHRGVVVFLDDLHLAPSSGLRLLREVASRLSRDPVWFLVTWSEEAKRRQRFDGTLLDAVTAGEVGHLRLPRLGATQVADLASELLAEGNTEEAVARLWEVSAGLPLGVVLQINLWWDEETLVPSTSARGRWQFVGRVATSPAQPLHLEDLAAHRVRRLSPFLRRVLSLAATVGRDFDADLLGRAEEEAPELVASALERLQERWILLPAHRHWAPIGRRNPVSGRVLGARTPAYEFDNEVIRQAVLARVSPERRRTLHGQMAQILARGLAAHDEETLAHHLAEVGDYRRALEVVKGAVARHQAAGVAMECLADLMRAGEVLTRACRRTNRA